MALVANILYNVNDKRAEDFLSQLLKMQKDDGSLNGLRHSITRSGGKALVVETTALSLLAIMKSKKGASKNLTKAVKFIISSRSSYGGFGNTQSTVLALKALSSYAKSSKRTAEPGKIDLIIDGQPAASKAYEKGHKDAVVVKGFEELLTEGEHSAVINYEVKTTPLPYTFTINYSTLMPPSSKETDVSLLTEIDEKKIKMGDTTRLKVKLTNIRDKGLPMTIAVIGIPAGLSVQPWQLKELQEKKAFDFYETVGNNLVIYYRQMKPSETKEINFDLKADIPGSFEGAASRAYLYYTNEYKSWNTGLKIEIEKP